MVCLSISLGGLGFDLFIVPLLLFRKTRVMGLLLVTAFHLTNNYLFYIGIFPWLMIAATLIFFSPSWPRRLMATIQRKEFHPADDVAYLPAFSPSHRLLTTLCVTVYLGIQLLVPLRHYFYPGNVSWTEEGHRFSWHMRLRSKTGNSIFFVTDPESRRMREYPRDKILDFITPLQYRNMSTRPDMILQFSHYLADRFQERGYPGVEVRARVLASLNGRAPQLLIDPAVDLVRVKARLWPPAPWILPLNEEK
ncbi:MAG: HTTM domain-containing protein [Nitrospinae bacterium]|nr:HTTM domain-containing protein [Nitrospinota bacterium]